MKNVTLDRTTVLQFDSDSTDSALDTAADRHVLRNDAALDLCAIADQKYREADLSDEQVLRNAVNVGKPTRSFGN